MTAGDCTTAKRIGEQIIAGDRESNDALMAHIVLFNCATFSGDTAAAKTQTAAIRAFPDDTGIASGLGLYLEAVAANQSGDAKTASLLGLRAIADAEKHDLPIIGALASVLMAGVFDDMGDCAAASKSARQALTLVNQPGSESLTGEIAQLIGGGGQSGTKSRQRTEARAHMLLGSCATDKTTGLRESAEAVKIAKDAGEELLLLEVMAQQADTAVMFDDCKTGLAASDETVDLGQGFPTTTTAIFRTQALGAQIYCAPLPDAVRAGDEALALVTPLRDSSPQLELSILLLYASVLFSNEEYKQACELIAAHPQALTEDQLLDTAAFNTYRILAAECPLFTPKNKAKLKDGIKIATKAVTSLKNSSDKSTLGLALYVRGLLYANAGDTTAARSDLQKAAQLGNQDAIDLLNGG
jgi:tetratricopeptide (TPR) repeat protein